MISNKTALNDFKESVKTILSHEFTLYPVGRKGITERGGGCDPLIVQILQQLDRIYQADHAWHDEWEYFPQDLYLGESVFREGQDGYKVLVPLPDLLVALKEIPSGPEWISSGLRDCFHTPARSI